MVDVLIFSCNVLIVVLMRCMLFLVITASFSFSSKCFTTVLHWVSPNISIVVLHSYRNCVWDICYISFNLIFIYVYRQSKNISVYYCSICIFADGGSYNLLHFQGYKRSLWPTILAFGLATILCIGGQSTSVLSFLLSVIVLRPLNRFYRRLEPGLCLGPYSLGGASSLTVSAASWDWS